MLFISYIVFFVSLENLFIVGPSNVKIMTRLELYELMQRQNLPNINEKLDFIENYLIGYDDYTADQIKDIKQNFSRFKSEMKSRWAAAYNKEQIFIKRNQDWLSGTFTIPKLTSRPGRPKKLFEESGERSKRQKTEELRSSVELNVLTHAAQIQLSASGKRDAAKILKEIISSPKRATKYKRAFSECEKRDQTRTQMTPTQALSLFVEANLSKSQYEMIRNANKKIYPCYSIIQKAKMECYPDKESINVTETCAEINIKALLDHTSKRLLMHLGEVLETLNDEERNALEMRCKWGCDGSQQAQYKQTFRNIADSDAYLFQSSFVPLQLICLANNKVIWQNPTPSSPRYCRPIRIRFVKESTDITLQEIEHVKNATNAINTSVISVQNNNYSITYVMMPTMVDGKVCNAAMQTKSTLRCYICGLTSKDFNDLTKTRDVNPEALQFGLSILHIRIRIFESLLHVAYRMPLKKGRLNKKRDDVSIVHQRKTEIQEEFRVRMGLLVDIPKPGFGNTNDGNSSRRFFGNPELVAEITGIDLNLIYRFKVILQTISSGHKINLEKFDSYTKKTAELYVQLYSWCPMTPTMHKLLIHGPDVIKHALLPIGQLSEEAAEARNRHFRLFRQNFSRKFSRVSCNQDVLNRLLLTSDPVITGMRNISRKKSKPFLKETLEMLLPMESYAESYGGNEASESDSEETADDSELCQEDNSFSD